MIFAASTFYQYHIWANKTLLSHLRSLPESVCRQQVQSVFPSIADVLVHLYVIDGGWQLALSGEGDRLTREWSEERIRAIEDKNLEQMIWLLLEQYREMAALLPLLDMEAQAGFAGFSLRTADILLHIVNHGSYHRGNITAMLHQVGYKSVPTDYSLFLYQTQQ